MKIEYLLIKQKNELCDSKDNFLSLLSANSRMKIEDNKFILSKDSFDYVIDSYEVEWNKNKETVFYLKVSKSANSKDDMENIVALEKFDAFLNRVNTEFADLFIINTIWDDVSIYYSKKLYPDIINVENMLRNLIYRFMIKIAGSSWFVDATPQKLKDNISKTAKRNQMENIPNKDQLYLADFIQLGVFFFEKYTTKPFGQDLIVKLKNLEDGSDVNSQIENIIDMYEAKSNWERYFADEIPVDNLYDKWQDLYNYRNDVAHAKRINGKDYKKACELIKELKEAFSACIDHIDDVSLTKDEVAAAHDFAHNIIINKEYFSDFWNIKYPGIEAMLNSIADISKLKNIQINYTRSFPGRDAFLQNISDMFDRLKLNYNKEYDLIEEDLNISSQEKKDEYSISKDVKELGDFDSGNVDSSSDENSLDGDDFDDDNDKTND